MGTLQAARLKLNYSLPWPHSLFPPPQIKVKQNLNGTEKTFLKDPVCVCACVCTHVCCFWAEQREVKGYKPTLWKQPEQATGPLWLPDVTEELACQAKAALMTRWLSELVVPTYETSSHRPWRAGAVLSTWVSPVCCTCRNGQAARLLAQTARSPLSIPQPGIRDIVPQVYKFYVKTE